MKVDIEFIIILTTPVLFSIILVLYWYTKRRRPTKWKLEVYKQLGEISHRSSTKDNQILQTVLIDIDKLLDYTMRMKGIKGETMGERLKNAKRYFKWDDYQKVWEGHKYRNKLVHEIGIKVDTNTIKVHFMALKKAVNGLAK